MEAEQQKRPVKIEVSEEFYRKLQDEKLRRNLTFQQIILRALDRYLAIPESLHREIEEEGRYVGRSVEEVALELARAWVKTARKGRGADVGRVPFPRSPELLADMNRLLEPLELIDAIKDYLIEMPVEKIRAVKESLGVDSKYYRSARIKEPRQRGKRQADRSEPSQKGQPARSPVNG
jgi:hypothetical protein